MRNIVLISLFCFVLISCNTIKYNRISIIRTNYAVLLNGDTIDLKNYYLNKKNIQTIKKDNNSQTISIIQKNKEIEYTLLCGLYNSTISLIIIDGEVIENCEKVKLELNTIKEISILKTDTARVLFCTPHKDILIITTK